VIGLKVHSIILKIQKRGISMKKKPFPSLCKDCKYSYPKSDYKWMNVCVNQFVISKDSWALGNNFEGRPNGKDCVDERSKRSWFAACGMRGKLWEGRE